jgi:DNA-binding MarR family transcriptional regulator
MSRNESVIPAAPPPQVEDCYCFAVRSAARHVTQMYDQVLAPFGLRTTQYSILAKLKLRGALTINALADALVMDRTSLARAIQPLQREGLIGIGAVPSDRRARQIHLTKLGEKRLRAAYAAWRKAQARFEAGFGAKRAADLRAILRAVVAGKFAQDEPDR